MAGAGEGGTAFVRPTVSQGAPKRNGWSPDCSEDQSRIEEKKNSPSS
jgi:hypothetical protein